MQSQLPLASPSSPIQSIVISTEALRSLIAKRVVERPPYFAFNVKLPLYLPKRNLPHPTIVNTFAAQL
ncbi:hypothetical protein [Tunturiibacter gelidoferens]|uniref:Uncharacterized protein n=1 Tax=Tunturiibacter gelidiferens TaxID=3069689 RepID=A0A9X0QBX6_9BACT|nr:hypothetical protein [Edaphobacter lichenicola]MBB5327424.1 hypothetical protein [Edaphobacter lichenicola]